MKIVRLVFGHIKDDFDWRKYLFVMVFLSGLFVFNFSGKIPAWNHSKWSGFGFLLFLNSAGYFTTLLVVLWSSKKLSVLKNKNLWLLSFGAIFFFTLSRSLHPFARFISLHEYWYKGWWLERCLQNLSPALIIIPAMFIIWFFVREKQERSLGLKFTGFSWKPFLWIFTIAIVLPFIASFTKGFQISYPSIRPWLLPDIFGKSALITTSVYEIAYGTDFLTIEFVFRGILIVGLVSLLGKDAILPMAVFYFIIHFGKPTGELISSFFGGYILGIFALNTRSIWPGVLLHLCLAWSMDLFASLQFYWHNPSYWPF